MCYIKFSIYIYKTITPIINLVNFHFFVHLNTVCFTTTNVHDFNLRHCILTKNQSNTIFDDDEIEMNKTQFSTAYNLSVKKHSLSKKMSLQHPLIQSYSSFSSSIITIKLRPKKN